MTTSAEPVRPAPRSRSRQRRGPGWVPNQHGAWAMLAVPLLVGVVASGGAWVHLPLTILWFVGYFAFFAVGLWAKSRFKKRWFPPVRAYSLASVPLAIVVLAMHPSLLVWAPAFLPLIGISLLCSYRRQDRSLLNDTVTVVAASLMLVVAYDAGDGTRWPQAWLAALVVFAYFAGTILYVKTVIRERGNRAYQVASTGYHLAVAALLPFLSTLLVPDSATVWIWPLVVFFLVLVARALIVPRTTATPVQTGIGEIVASSVLTALILTCVV